MASGSGLTKISRDATPIDVIEGRARWCVVHAAHQDVLPSLPDKSIGVCITDPPYSDVVHGGSRRLVGKGRKGYRDHDYGFESLSPSNRTACALEIGRLVSRWALVFSDVESGHLWREALELSGLEFIRFGAWLKLQASPQFTGDRPGSLLEQITIMHPSGKKRWGGGGMGNVWIHPVAKAHDVGVGRIHTAQKPESLMLELLALFSEPDEIVLDCYAGSGTTGACALRLGRRCILVEKNAEYAEMCRKRLDAEERNSTIQAVRAGQLGLFG